MPTLEEIFGKEKPSLDDIFNGNQQVETQPTQQPQEDEGILSNIADGLKTIVTAPASAALDVISYLDKPRGAIAGAVSQYLHDDTPSLNEIFEGAKKGWSENTSWKESLPDDFKKENPIASSVAGFVGDVVLDPAWLLTPAKIGAGLAKGSKAVGLTDKVINPATKAFKASEAGQKIIANAEDFVGVSRLRDTGIVDDLRHGLSVDDVLRTDVTDAIADLRKPLGNEYDKITKYVEAAERPSQLENIAIHNKAVDNVATQSLKDFASDRMQNISNLRNNIIDDISNKIINEPLYQAERMAEVGSPNLATAKGIANRYLKLRNSGINIDPNIDKLGKQTIDFIEKYAKKNGFNNGQELAQHLKELPPFKQSIKDVRDKMVKAVPFSESNAKRYPKWLQETNAIKLGLTPEQRSVNAFDKLAKKVGFNSGDELAQQILSNPTYKQAVEKDISSQVKNAFPGLKIEKENLYNSIKQTLNNGQSGAVNNEAKNVLADMIVKSNKDGSIFKRIKNGEFSKEQAFEVLRNTGEKIPDQLLQQHQVEAKITQRADKAKLVKYLRQEIINAENGGNIELVNELKSNLKEIVSNKNISMPGYVYRDQILNSITDPKIRQQIQEIGDKIIEINKKNSNKMFDIGQIDVKDYVHFMDGSHLRRSYGNFESAEDFLKAVRRNGTKEEWERAYSNFQKTKIGREPSMSKTANYAIDQKDFIKRQKLSEKTMQKMGIITDPQYRVMDTLTRSSKTFREDELLTKVNQLFGTTAEDAARLSRNIPKAREYIPVPQGKAYGQLAGKWVPRDVYNEVVGVMGNKPDNINKTWQKLVSWWKVGKLANPSSIMRNFYSGLPMANAFGNVPLKNIPIEMARVTKAFSNGGKNNPLIREIRASGALEGKWIRSELDTILKGNKKGIGKYAEKGMEAFGAPDEFWRAVVYSYHRGQGASVKEAGKIARKALLDYSSSPEWINTLGKSGIVPFARFPFLAGKETAKTLWRNPASITKYTKAQNQVNNSDREQLLPGYMKARTLLPIGDTTRTVNGKPQKVQQNIDLSYILPFANDFTAGNPVMDAIMLHRTGMNGLGQKVIKPGMTDTEKAKAYAEYYGNALLPTIASPYTINRLKNGFEGNVDKMGRQYDAKSAIAQTLLGIKNVPVNTDEMFRNKMTKIKSDQNNAKMMISSIQKDASLSAKQKKELINDHISQIQELQKEAVKTQQAYKNEKSRGK